MGTVRKDPRSSGWQARYRDKAGRQRTKTFESRGDAKRYLDSVESDLTRGTYCDPQAGKVRFADFAAEWRKSVVHLRAGTLSNIDTRMAVHILPEFGKYPLSAIEPSDVRAWVAGLTRKDLAPTSVVPIYRLFARIMSVAESDGKIPRSPCRGVALPAQVSRTEMRFLTPEQIRDLAETIGPRYRALIYTAAYTGMRWGECGALTVTNCKLLHGRIDVVQSLTEVGGHHEIGPTKTGKVRSIAIPRFLGELLADHIARFPGEEDIVFTGVEGMPLRRHFLRRHFHPAVKQAGLEPGLRFHDLRHTCVSLLIAQGAHPKEISERLGHSTIKLTFDRYGHLLPSLDDRLRDGLDRLWNESLASADAAVRTVVGLAT